MIGIYSSTVRMVLDDARPSKFCSLQTYWPRLYDIANVSWVMFTGLITFKQKLSNRKRAPQSFRPNLYMETLSRAGLQLISLVKSSP